MKQFWHIVPIGNGCTYMGYEDGRIVPRSKMLDDTDISLVWEHKSNCEAYLRNHLDPRKYKAEEIWLDEEYYRLNCKEQESTD